MYRAELVAPRRRSRSATRGIGGRTSSRRSTRPGSAPRRTASSCGTSPAHGPVDRRLAAIVEKIADEGRAGAPISLIYNGVDLERYDSPHPGAAPADEPWTSRGPGRRRLPQAPVQLRIGARPRATGARGRCPGDPGVSTPHRRSGNEREEGRLGTAGEAYGGGRARCRGRRTPRATRRPPGRATTAPRRHPATSATPLDAARVEVAVRHERAETGHADLAAVGVAGQDQSRRRRRRYGSSTRWYGAWATPSARSASVSAGPATRSSRS